MQQKTVFAARIRDFSLPADTSSAVVARFFNKLPFTVDLALMYLSHKMRFVVLSLLFLSISSAVLAQALNGQVVDANTGQAIGSVSITNTYTRSAIVTSSDGTFSITGSRDELIEFRKLGYKIVRIRVPGVIPPYFKIAMTQGEIELPEFELYTRGKSKDYKSDSIKYAQLYKGILDFPKMSGIDMMRSPFSALSKSNRQKWAFQENYKKFQEMKYVDYAFNDKIITQITGLTGDTLANYKIRFRPSYEQLRSMTEYNFYLYIRQSAEQYMRRFSRPRNPG